MRYALLARPHFPCSADLLAAAPLGTCLWRHPACNATSARLAEEAEGWARELSDLAARMAAALPPGAVGTVEV